MRPCTPHAVVTPESAICLGGHFYAISTLRESCFGVLQSFSTSQVVTNTEHIDTSRFLLERITYMLSIVLSELPPCGVAADLPPHSPNIYSWDGMVDTWMLINLMELIHITHPHSYDPKRRISSHDRRRMIEGRKAGRTLRNWLWQNFDLQTTSGEAVDKQEVYFSFLALQCRALLHHKRLAQDNYMEGEVEVEYDTLQARILDSFKGEPRFIAQWDKAPSTLDSFAYPDPPLQVISISAEASTSPGISQISIRRWHFLISIL